MKKQYISPETLSLKLCLGNMMQTGSPINVESNTENPIGVGGDATEGGSDSRRHRDIWEDEEEEELY